MDEREQSVKAGDVICMKAGCRHTVIADTELQMIEVQLGQDITVHDKKRNDSAVFGKLWGFPGTALSYCNRYFSERSGS